MVKNMTKLHDHLYQNNENASRALILERQRWAYGLATSFFAIVPILFFNNIKQIRDMSSMQKRIHPFLIFRSKSFIKIFGVSIISSSQNWIQKHRACCRVVVIENFIKRFAVLRIKICFHHILSPGCPIVFILQYNSIACFEKRECVTLINFLFPALKQNNILFSISFFFKKIKHCTF